MNTRCILKVLSNIKNYLTKTLNYAIKDESMPSQYEKRKAKAAAEAAARKADEMKQEIADMAEQGLEPVIGPAAESMGMSEPAPEVDGIAQFDKFYTQHAYDIFTSDGGKTYHVAEIHYNPQTGHALVGEIFDISRLVALSYANQKTALGTLKKGKK